MAAADVRADALQCPLDFSVDVAVAAVLAAGYINHILQTMI